MLETLAKEYGFTLKLYPVPAAEMQNQSSVWLGIRRDRPDWIYLQGWGAMNPTAVREAARIGFDMNQLDRRLVGRRRGRRPSGGRRRPRATRRSTGTRSARTSP